MLYYMDDFWAQTQSGRKIHFLSPSPDEVFIGDVAHHLARVNRYTGAIKWDNYSVAQHSVLCARVAQRAGESPRVCMTALLHDAHEMVTGDLSTPLKRTIEFCTGSRVIKEIEDRLDSVIWESLVGNDLPSDEERAIARRIDSWILGVEVPAVLGSNPEWAKRGHCRFDAYKEGLLTSGWLPKQAQAAFKRAYNFYLRRM